MLQDLRFGQLKNEFRDILPEAQDVVICICQEQILLKRNADDTLELPDFNRVRRWEQVHSWKSWKEETVRYLFCLQGVNFFLWMGETGACDDPCFAYEPVRRLRQLTSKDVCFGIMTAWHLFTWYRNNRYCGHCGKETVHDARERMLRCPECGNMIYPKISPAVIIAVTDGDRILLSKYAGRNYTHYALLAGYVS